jgi:hypothetical protein
MKKKDLFWETTKQQVYFFTQNKATLIYLMEYKNKNKALALQNLEIEQGSNAKWISTFKTFKYSTKSDCLYN